VLIAQSYNLKNGLHPLDATRGSTGLSVPIPCRECRHGPPDREGIACQDLAIVAGSDHFIRRLLHEPDIVGVLPDNGGAGWF
jgi:hypothetical protein